MKFTKFFLFLAVIGLFAVSCKDDEKLENILKSEKYGLTAIGDDGFDGEIVFDKINDTETVITIELDGDNTSTPRPAHIHENTAIEGGDIAISLNPVINGKSETTVTMKDDGSAITYEDLIDYNGYVNVHESSSTLNVIVSQGDIGQNDLTGEEKTYTLESRGGTDVKGTITFRERENGTTFAEFNLDNTVDGLMHPAHIHQNTFAEGGAIAVSFNPIDGNTGYSGTQISTTDNGASISYSEILNYNGYVNVHLSSTDLTVVSQTDIGSNEISGDDATYTLAMKDGSGVQGTATFLQRKNGNSLVVLALSGTTAGEMHPAHIHEGSVSTAPGAIAVSLTPVDGTTGVSYTNVTKTDAGINLDFEGLEDIDGYINIHKSASELEIVVAQGDVGKNAG